MEVNIPSFSTNPEIPLRIILVSTCSPKHPGLMESLGPEVLAGYLNAAFPNGEVTTSHFDLQIRNLEDLRRILLTTPPHILGVSLKIGALDQAKEIYGIIRDMKGEGRETPLLILGGIVPTFASSSLLEIFPGSIICKGEGEVTLKLLCSAARRGRINLEKIPGITYQTEERVISIPPQLPDLLKEDYSPARITTREIYQRGGGIWFETSRGCNGSCTFCSRAGFGRRNFTEIPLSRVVTELERLEEMGVLYVEAADDDFGSDQERLLSLAEEIRKRGLTIKFSASTRADNVYRKEDSPEKNHRRRQAWQEIHKAGLTRVFIGLESGSPSQLKRYGKRISVEENLQAIRILQEIGIEVVAGYIAIDPLMSIEELKETLYWLYHIGRMHQKVSNPLSVMRVQAGSPYIEMLKRAGLLGEPTKELVFFEIKGYKDPRVAIVAKAAQDWVEENYAFIFGIKGIETSQAENPDYKQEIQAVKKFLYTLREIEMLFILELVDYLYANQEVNLAVVEEIKEKHRAKKNQFIQRFLEENPSLIEKNPHLLSTIS